jgi:hypothetical protein
MAQEIRFDGCMPIFEAIYDERCLWNNFVFGKTSRRHSGLSTPLSYPLRAGEITAVSCQWVHVDREIKAED